MWFKFRYGQINVLLYLNVYEIQRAWNINWWYYILNALNIWFFVVLLWCWHTLQNFDLEIVKGVIIPKHQKNYAKFFILNSKNLLDTQFCGVDSSDLTWNAFLASALNKGTRAAYICIYLFAIAFHPVLDEFLQVTISASKFKLL